MKICSKCKVELPVSEFYNAKINKDGSICYQARCKSCMNEDTMNRVRNMTPEERSKKYKKNREKLGKDYFKNYKLKNQYGISLDIFNKMYEEQNGQCYLCLKTFSGKEVKVDHNHETGQVRKLLCHNCNTSLGLLNENPDLFYRCANYLKEHNDSIPKSSLA